MATMWTFKIRMIFAVVVADILRPEIANEAVADGHAHLEPGTRLLVIMIIYIMLPSQSTTQITKKHVTQTNISQSRQQTMKTLLISEMPILIK